mmetsp:Transcript_20259/g.30058  ORF Transcript_20259/g.30058 Transcript_20259/m.30058 type:complete len:238 (+) Transcript_20259:829-1542(+)
MRASNEDCRSIIFERDADETPPSRAKRVSWSLESPDFRSRLFIEEPAAVIPARRAADAFRAICAIAEFESPLLLLDDAAARGLLDGVRPESAFNKFCLLLLLPLKPARANKPALPLEERDGFDALRSKAVLKSLDPSPCRRARPAAAALRFAPPPERLAAASAAPCPCLKPSGGFNHGGDGGELSMSSFIFSVAVETVAAPPPPPTPDDFTRFVCATLSKKRRSSSLNSARDCCICS